MGIPCVIFFVLKKAGCRKLRSTSQCEIFDRFLVPMTQPCWRKARKTKQNAAKRAAERLLRFESSLLMEYPVPPSQAENPTLRDG